MFRRLIFLFLVIILIGAAGLPSASVQIAQAQQSVDPAAKAKSLLLKMTPEEKVGQLFIVTFKGRDVTNPDQKILDMVMNRLIGGIVLSSANDNLSGPTGTLNDIQNLTNALQIDKYAGSQKSAVNPITKGNYTPQYIPLFIGISQEGDLAPNDQILSGMTPLPNEMAVGATWNTTLAEKVGSTMGSELQALGFNLYLGPSLDVLDSVVGKESGDDLGTRAFGGDPYWVGVMGEAYIKGLHEGSDQKLVVVSKNFPGRGDADRSPESDIATVKKSLEQLKQIELAPFFSVTGNASSPESATDGLLVSHIRYQGFQGNIRATTRPISFDQTALDLILNLPAFASWRQAGGVLMSDNLGSAGIRKFFDPTGTSFDGRQIALNAFLAGNDLLYLDNFVSSTDSDPFTTLQRTLDLFAQKYREDTAFAQRVDASVTRILTLKYRLYPDFSLNNVTTPEDALQQIGQGQQVSFDVARQGATLISPSQSELSQVLPRPELRERFVFLTDSLSARQCSTCTNQPMMAVDALQNAVLRLYGPNAGGQVLPGNLSSYSFVDLINYLDSNKDTPPNMQTDLAAADWVVISALNVQSTRPESVALQRLLSEQPDLIRNKRVILFAFNAPYYLDATDISKLTAFYGLYSKTPAFIEMAARILFQELVPPGNPPVSVPGAGYDLSVATSPDPAQVISLYLDLPPATSLTPQTTPSLKPSLSPTPTQPPKFKVGDNLPLKTGVILDNNANPVPDGTVVHFLFTIGTADSSTQSQIDTTTTGGIGRASLRIPSAGLLEIRVVAEPALTSNLLRLEISSTGAVAIQAITPTSQPTFTPTVTQTITPTITATMTPTPTPMPPPKTGASDWLLANLITWGAAFSFFWLGRSLATVRWAIRWALMAAVGGLVAYFYLAIQFPGSQVWMDNTGKAGILIVTLIGSVVGWVGGVIWKRWIGQRARMEKPRRSNEPML